MLSFFFYFSSATIFSPFFRGALG
uniref:Uncharacterized protein n=1 Tax=Arundo donax TaxID=35708 RepID=A0A0A8YFU4_ARUDO